ncbi:MAG: hypothetical protein HYV33_05780 [Candidatus Kerfeldbacteria bacterium]|nr:hypothetical protein [Candidatus Kerfeldbacteria bacterium]
MVETPPQPEGLPEQLHRRFTKQKRNLYEDLPDYQAMLERLQQGRYQVGDRVLGFDNQGKASLYTLSHVDKDIVAEKLILLQARDNWADDNSTTVSLTETQLDQFCLGEQRQQLTHTLSLIVEELRDQTIALPKKYLRVMNAALAQNKEAPPEVFTHMWQTLHQAIADFYHRTPPDYGQLLDRLIKLLRWQKRQLRLRGLRSDQAAAADDTTWKTLAKHRLAQLAKNRGSINATVLLSNKYGNRFALTAYGIMLVSDLEQLELLAPKAPIVE